MNVKVLALAIALCLPRLAFGATIKLCFLTTADFSDNGYALANGVKEDYWVSDANRLIRGAKFEIRVSGTPIASGRLGDGFGSSDPGKGCTPTLTRSDVNVAYDIKIWAETRVQGNTIKGRNKKAGCFRSFRWTNTEGSGTYDVEFHGVSEACNDVWRAVNTASYAIYRHAGGVTGKTFTVRVAPKCEGDQSQGSGECCRGNNGSSELLCLTPHRRKFTMVHEMGHSLSGARDGDLLRGGHCGDDDDSCPSDPNQAESVAHEMGSREFQICAFQEAFAHFYAADVWNDHGQQDCVYRYYKTYKDADGNEFGKPTIDCETHRDSGDDTVVDAAPADPSFHAYRIPYMERTCDTPHAKRGAEIDWLRALWDVHGNKGRDGQGGGVSMKRMLDWMAGAIDVWDDSIEQELTNKADEMGGTLKANWLGGGAQGIGARERYGIAQ